MFYIIFLMTDATVPQIILENVQTITLEPNETGYLPECTFNPRVFNVAQRL